MEISQEFSKYQHFTQYRSYFSQKTKAIGYIEVTFRKKLMLYAVSKLLFYKNNAICFIKVTLKRNK